MESCRPAIIVSFGVTAHLAPVRVSVQQESIPWQSFVLMQSRSSRFETLRSALVAQAFVPVFFKGWAMAIFRFSDTFVTAEVCLTQGEFKKLHNPAQSLVLRYPHLRLT
jgi:hypothetical protein